MRGDQFSVTQSQSSILNHIYSRECIKPVKLCRSLLRIPVIRVFGTAGNDSKVGRSVIFFQEEQIVLKRRARISA